MKRYLIKKLHDWKTSSKRKPLILRGVRQTGKTYLLEAFGKEAFSRYHIINFEQQPKAANIFEKDLVPSRIIDDLQFFLKTKININHDLVIFDEIQACPKALTSLKYFCEDMPNLALCSAGSLLGLHLSDASFPVGKVDMLYLHPMTFGEFLMGIEDEQCSEAFSNLSLDSSLSDVAHEALWNRLKHYFITGGLPEVVSIFAEHNDLYSATHAVREKQNDLIRGYYADIAKHAGKVNSMHIDRVWRAVPQQLSQTQDSGAKRFRFKGIISSVERYSQLVNVIDWLDAAELIIKVPIIETVKQPLSAFRVENKFKLLMFDVGILGALSNLDPESILNYDYGTYKGYFAENFVAQQLQVRFQSLYSWQSSRAELEFLLQHEGEIIPLEVKAGEKTRSRSLQQFIRRYSPKQNYILSGKNFSHLTLPDSSSELFYVPLYFAEKID